MEFEGTMKYVPLGPTSRVLELGCGDGFQLGLLRQRFQHVFAIDPNRRPRAVGGFVYAFGEALPFPDEYFDLLISNCVVEHLVDRACAMEEGVRVLKPGGRLLILELTAPQSAAGRAFLGLYLGRVVPFVARVRSGNREAGTLMRYYWDTIRTCVRPEAILQALAEAGFADVERHVEFGVFSEYSARRP